MTQTLHKPTAIITLREIKNPEQQKKQIIVVPEKKKDNKNHEKLQQKQKVPVAVVHT